MFFRSILVLLVLPPVNLVFVTLAALAMQRVWPQLGRCVAAVAVLLLLLLALPAVAGSLLCTLETDLPLTPPAAQPPGAIVILGAEITRTGGDHPGALVGRLTLERLRAGAELQRRTQLPILVSGGTTARDAPTVAALMQQSLTQDFQVPVRWSETASRDTWENAQDSAAVLRAAGIHSIYLVTHGWHERRALIAFANTGITVTAAPTSLDRWPTPLEGDFLPRVSAWSLSYFALHEWIGCLWYSLR